MSELSELSKRFLIAIDKIGLTGYRLAKEIPEISQSTLTHIRNGRNEPSKLIISLFLKKYPVINSGWLYTGNGEMIDKTAFLNFILDEGKELFKSITSKSILENYPEIKIKRFVDQKKFNEYLKICQLAPEFDLSKMHGEINNQLSSALYVYQFFEGIKDSKDIQLLPVKSSDEANKLSEFQFMNIPFVPIFAQAGYGKGYGDQEYIDNLPTMPVIVDKTYKGKYRVFEVKGDSMDDGSRKSLCEGDKILCREVRQELWHNKLHIKDWFFVICMKDNGILVKQILSHEVETGEIVCHSLNSLFDDFKMNLSEVCELYNVIKIVDRNTRI